MGYKAHFLYLHLFNDNGELNPTQQPKDAKSTTCFVDYLSRAAKCLILSSRCCSKNHFGQLGRINRGRADCFKQRHCSARQWVSGQQETALSRAHNCNWLGCLLSCTYVGGVQHQGGSCKSTEGSFPQSRNRFWQQGLCFFSQREHRMDTLIVRIIVKVCLILCYPLIIAILIQ